ncbi:MAG: LSU ribosomal protein L4 RplD [Bacteroidetes bacterium HLUCCA01]|nr:MAG: LSU ribosomal protein L4 RplD [Bacteroidetes bacterium HLUCCA01]
MKLNVLKTDGSDSGRTVELREDIFNIAPHDQLIYEDIRSYLAAQRQGTAKTKGRTEVRGGGRKAFRQKGTGGARRGSLRSPLLKGGGTVFGPKVRTYSVRLNKKMKQLARKSALTYKAAENGIVVIEDFNFDEPKTKQMKSLISTLGLAGKKTLLLTADTQLNVYKSARNLEKLNTMEVFRAATYNVVNCDVVLIQESAMQTLQNSFSQVEEVQA